MNDATLSEHVLYLLDGGGAHLDFDKAVAELPVELRGAKVVNIPHSPWRLVEHMRICQWDILEFCQNPDHVSPEFPDGYWPSGDSPPTANSWDESVSAFCSDLVSMQRLVADPQSDLFAQIPYGDGQTLLREAMLVADHNSYHLGQLLVIRRGLGR